MTQKTFQKLCFFFVVLVCLSGCADLVSFEQASQMNPVGFLHGLWHGFILPFSFLISLLEHDVAIYAIYNNGGWYNLGFVIGVWFIISNLILTNLTHG